MKRTYIKPEIEFVAINETMSLLGGSGPADETTGDLEPQVYQNVRIQSKEHNLWDTDETGWDE